MSTVLIRDRNPINQPFDGAHFHHLHINNNHTVGIYIPEEIHIANNHANWKYDKAALRRINSAALLWLCKQETIEGDIFNPGAQGTYVKVKNSVLVQLPHVEKEIRAKLNVLKATRKDTTVGKTLRYLLSLEEKNAFLEKRCTLKENDCNDLIAQLASVREHAEKVPALEARIKELEETTLSKDEASALYSAIGDVDLWKEDDEYKALVQSAVNKLWKMKQELK